MSSTLRSVPSAGARHPFETYLIVKSVTELEPGLYRYLALDHKLCFCAPMAEMRSRAIDESWLLPNEAILFVWTAVPYRTEWRYDKLSHKMIAIEAGHICQNLYLAGLAFDVGTCAIGAFPQEEMDTILAVDGQDEFSVYMASVGKID
jgi:SagB-type dehydrogenase family enzyme